MRTVTKLAYVIQKFADEKVILLDILRGSSTAE